MTRHPEHDPNKELLWLLREKYGGIKTDAYYRDAIRVKSGEPIDYVIGFTPFLHCQIDLSCDPLIPRQETEYWVENLIAEHRGRPALTCLDIYSGSGCIGVALAKHFYDSKVTFGELDKNLLEQTKLNLSLNDIDHSRTDIYQSNCFSSIPIMRYDIITANPPYIAYERIAQVSRSVSDWEPMEALFAQDEGLHHIKIILKEAQQYLNDGGYVYIEFDHPQYEAIKEILDDHPLYTADFIPDQFGKWRTLKLVINN